MNSREALAMPIPHSCHVPIAQFIASRQLDIALCTGDGNWTIPPSKDKIATTLMNEFARRRATKASFVVPVDEEYITSGTSWFSVSDGPTNRLLISTQSVSHDEQQVQIREIAILVVSKVVKGATNGRGYTHKSDVMDPGRMLHVENLASIFRQLGSNKTSRSSSNLGSEYTYLSSQARDPKSSFSRPPAGAPYRDATGAAQ